MAPCVEGAAVTGYALRLNPGELERYLQMGAIAREHEGAHWARAGIVPGARVADIGCGPGGTLAAMAAVVGPDGSIVGVDGDPDAVAAATQLIASAGLGNATARLGKATDTGVPPGSVDVVMMRHVLAHNGAIEQDIVNHLATLPRPGGCVYLADIEATTFRIWPEAGPWHELWDRYSAFHVSRGNDLRVGTRLGELLQRAGLELVVETGLIVVLRGLEPGWWGPPWAAREAMIEAGFVTREEVEEWRAQLEAVEAGPVKPTRFIPLYIAVGRAPGG